MQWSQAFGLVCEVVQRIGLDYMTELHRSRLLGVWNDNDWQWNGFFTWVISHARGGGVTLWPNLLKWDDFTISNHNAIAIYCKTCILPTTVTLVV